MSAARLRRFAVGALAAASVIVIVGVVDYDHTVDRAPPASRGLCLEPVQPECQQQLTQQSSERDATSDALEEGFLHREWIYALLFTIAIAIAILAELRARPAKADKRRLLSYVGAAGVSGGVLAVVLSAGAESPIEIGQLPLYVPPLFLMAVAAIGGALAYPYWETADAPQVDGQGLAVSGLPPPDHYGPVETMGRRVALAGLAFALLTFILASLFAGQQPACGGGDNQPSPASWADSLAVLAYACAVLAACASVIALLVRRWILALVCLVGTVLSLGYMAASTCAFY